jgi:hypothetical protein
VDRVTTSARRISFDFHGDGGSQTVTVEVATSHDGITYSSFATLTDIPVTARFYKFKVTAISDYPELSFGNLLFFV